VQWHHPVETIWRMTPRNAFAWLELGIARRRRERAEALADRTLAAQGKRDAIERVLKELDDA
jgi:hypothetical protein